jgi:hypothetical protein
MKIDLRYVICVLAFYVPGLLMGIGVWLLGLSGVEARIAIAIAGGLMGCGTSVVAAVILFEDKEPIWVHIGKQKE